MEQEASQESLQGPSQESSQESSHARNGSPVFFLSYARSAPGRSARRPPTRPATGDDAFLRTFYHDLSKHVQQLVGTRLGAVPGFIDLSITPGRKWEETILEMVSRATVFVALLSADYVESPWCGREWYAFSRRTLTHRDGGDSHAQTTILPVVWSRLDPARVPKVVQEVQEFAPDIQDDRLHHLYLHNGIYGLLASESGDYAAVVWQLAQLVADLYYAFDVPAGEPPTLDELRDAFKEKTP